MVDAKLWSQESDNARLSFSELPNLPDEVGVAGPFVAVSNDVLVVAGGANFSSPDDPELWSLPKRFHNNIWILERNEIATEVSFRWNDKVDGKLSTHVAYGSSVDTPIGMLCMGGENSKGLTRRAFLLTVSKVEGEDGGWTVTENDLGVPDLPAACSAGGAVVLGDYVYLVAGQVQDGKGNSAASRSVWRINLKQLKADLSNEVNDNTERWQPVASWPESGPRRMFAQVTVQHNGFGNRLYVIGGRRFANGSDKTNLLNLQSTSDGWAFDPGEFDTALMNAETGEYSGPPPWKRIADAPTPLTAGTAVPYGPAHIIVPGAATLEILHQVVKSGVEMKDFNHPGFPRKTYAYHTITDTWIEMGNNVGTQVTTPAVRWHDDILMVSGEVRPRVRTNKSWRIQVKPNRANFGIINMSVVVAYLLAMLVIGAFFTFRSKSTDDYFRGGKNIPWWAAGCSIFATMLSSITYMAVPAKAFAQDWVYAVGNLLILAVAPIAIYYALPFFRRIDATSAYEYLERRFNRTARLIGSGSFTLFHIFRMGVVLALAALALASVTPLTPSQCVIVMGVLSIIYCTLGGIEAVIWTDTIQTLVLVGGALLCITFAYLGSEAGSFSAAVDADKFHFANLNFGSKSFTTMAIWVVILGGAGQNLASYTADQAVVQRYMTTSDEKMAAKSIWLNGFMAIPAALIFFGMGTAFWMFYRSNPENLDPTIAADRIMPLFISHELPVGLAGLVVAGIFAAAQSTVSTSMNSGATTVVTDFIRPTKLIQSEKALLWSARLVTLTLGAIGTYTGLLFIDPTIKSLFDQFIGILGMFLGVLAGLFILGATSRRANGTGSLIGAFTAIAAMMLIVLAANDKTIFNINFRAIFDSIGFPIYKINGYLYAFVGICICYSVGSIASFFFLQNNTNLDGLVLTTPKNG